MRESKEKPASVDKSSVRTAAALDLARANPEFARVCTQRLSAEAREQLIAAMMTARPALRPIKKALPRIQPTELSIQLRSYAKAVKR